MIITICDYCKKKVEKVNEIGRGEVSVHFSVNPFQSGPVIVTQRQTSAICVDGHHICDECCCKLADLLTAAIEFETKTILGNLVNDG